MSTWGLACASDIGYPAAMERVRTELRTTPSGGNAVLSSAYLYEAEPVDQRLLDSLRLSDAAGERSIVW